MEVNVRLMEPGLRCKYRLPRRKDEQASDHLKAIAPGGPTSTPQAMAIAAILASDVGPCSPLS